MKLLGTCSLLKESHEKKKKKKKKKWDSLGSGTSPIFGERDFYFLAGTPTFYKMGVPDFYF